MYTYTIVILCVIGISIGQILFKASANSWIETGSLFSIKTSLTFISAIFLYALTTIAWVWVLQKIDLGKAYPIMALAFILVPIGSYLYFGENFTFQYFLGVAFIILGITITVSA